MRATVIGMLVVMGSVTGGGARRADARGDATPDRVVRSRQAVVPPPADTPADTVENDTQPVRSASSSSGTCPG